MSNTINVTRTSMPDFEEYCNEIKDIWDSRWLTNFGPKHQKFEAELKEYLGVENVSLYTNGHLALENAIACLRLETGSEVITTPFTFVSTTNAIIRNGFTPVFCDIKPDDYTIDPDKIEALITPKTRAIVPVHVYGNICDVKKIEKIAKKYNLKVIYDAAHAFGVKFNGESVLKYGDLSMLSFHATKVMNTIEGGALCYGDSGLYQELKDRNNFGLKSLEEGIYIGGNAKMNEFQAAMGLCNLRNIDVNIQKRKAIVEHYNSRLSGIKGIKAWHEQENVTHNYAYYPLVFDGYKYSRDEVFDRLKEQNIFGRKYFYPLTSDLKAVRELFAVQSTPIAEGLTKRVLCLPIYPELSYRDVDRICDIILK